jgi:hypothetical protein
VEAQVVGLFSGENKKNAKCFFRKILSEWKADQRGVETAGRFAGEIFYQGSERGNNYGEFYFGRN